MVDKLFPLGHPVPEEDLVGRLHFVDTLVSRLEEGNSIMLAGPRRIGKTSQGKRCQAQGKRCQALHRARGARHSSY